MSTEAGATDISNSHLKVLEIQKQLDKICSSSSGNSDQTNKAAIECLRALKDLPMSYDILVSTRIGRRVNELRRASQDKEFKCLARILIENWRKFITPPGSGQDLEPDNKQSQGVVQLESNRIKTGQPSESEVGMNGNKDVDNDVHHHFDFVAMSSILGRILGDDEHDVQQNTNTKFLNDVSRAEQQQQHPLLNSIVLATVAKYLTHMDLVSLRATCSAWNEVLTPQLRKRNPPIVISAKSLASALWWNSYSSFTSSSSNQQSPTAASDFFTTMSNCLTPTTPPFGRYQIENISYHTACIGNFLSVYGTCITWLELIIQNHELNMSQYRAMLFKYCPALKELKVVQKPSVVLGDDQVFWKQDRLFNPEFPSNSSTTLPNLTKFSLSALDLQSDITQVVLKDLVNAAINLEALSVVQVDPSESADETHNIVVSHNLSILAALRDKPTGLDRLKSLKLHNLGSTELMLLVQLSSRKSNCLKLIEFECKQDGMGRRREQRDVVVANLMNLVFDGIMTQLKIFLDLQATNLESLHLSIYHGFALELPILGNLKSLSVSTSKDASFGCFRIPSFSAHFPRLEQFSYHYQLGQYQDLVGETNFIQEGLEETPSSYNPINTLRTLDVAPTQSPVELQQLATLFPGISKLVLGLTSLNLLSLVWSHWPQLQILHIDRILHADSERLAQFELSHAIDEIITGIPSKHHSALREIIERSNGDPLKWLETILRNCKTAAGIGDMKRLSEFKLKTPFVVLVKNDSAVACITDISCYFGFALLKDNLRYLQVQPSDMVTDTCRGFMALTLSSDAKIDFDSKED